MRSLLQKAVAQCGLFEMLGPNTRKADSSDSSDSSESSGWEHGSLHELASTEVDTDDNEY